MHLTKDSLKEARHQLGLTAAELAKTLRMGKCAGRTIRRYERGESPIPGPVSVAIEALLSGFVPENIEED